jgi:signal transduction histidine kinase
LPRGREGGVAATGALRYALAATLQRARQGFARGIHVLGASPVLVSSRAQMAWIAGVTCAFVAALSAMFLWMAWHSRATVIADTFASSSNLALSVEQFVARTMETVDLTLRIVAEQVVPGTGRTKRRQVLLAERVRQAPQVIGLMVIGDDGRVRVSTGQLPKPSTDVESARYFSLARDSADIRLVVEDAPGLHPGPRKILVAARRFNHADGTFAGVVAATLNADYVQRFLSTLHVGELGVIGIETSDGTMLVRQPYREGSMGANIAATPLFTEWLPWASSGVFPVQSEEDRLWRIVAYQRVEKLPLVVEVALSQDEALATWHRTTMLQAGAGALILVLSAATAFALNRQLQARLRAHRQLNETVRELERARIAAEEASRVKSQFMANISHELRTPLNAVIGYSELLIEEAEGDEGKRQQFADLRRISGAGHHLLGMIDELLDISEIEVGRLELREGLVDLKELIDDCAGTIAERARAAGLELAIEPAPELPHLKADGGRLRQILLNLLSNAVKFTAPGGRIVLGAAPAEDGGVLLSISDTGIGMAPDEIPIALEPFRQVNGTLNRRREGTGLGLPLARALAELHGGTLSIDSVPGRGTTINVTLPSARVVPPTRSPAKSMNSAQKRASGSG